jgi:hypothetical protein
MAIAFEITGGVTTGNSLTLNVGSNANRFLTAATWNGTGTGITGTFNGVSMTQSPTDTIQAGYFLTGLYLANPTAGSQALATTGTGNGAIVGAAYSGVKQATPVTTTANSAGTSISVSITTSTPNCWLVVYVLGNNNTPTAGTNATLRTAQNSSSNAPSVFDSGGVITTGGYTMTINGFTAQAIGAVAYLLEPFAVTTNPAFLSNFI